MVGTGDRDGLEKQIVATSLRYGVLSRFTAFVAVDQRVVNEGGEVHKVTQPVDLPSGWEPPAAQPAGAIPAGAPVIAQNRQAFGAAPGGGFAQAESRVQGFAGDSPLGGGAPMPPQPPLAKPAPSPDLLDSEAYALDEMARPPSERKKRVPDAITPPVAPPPATLATFVTEELQRLHSSATADVWTRSGLLSALAERIRLHLTQWESRGEPQNQRLTLTQLAAQLALPTADPAEVDRRWTHATTTLTTMTTSQAQRTRRTFWKR